MSKSNFVLLVCDAQPDLLKSLPDDRRQSALAGLRISIEAARTAGWTIVFTGVQFEKKYEGLPNQHKLYGGFKRLNAKMGDDKVHWFMRGYPGADIERSLVSAAAAMPDLPEDFQKLDVESMSSCGSHRVKFLYRQQHLPSEFDLREAIGLKYDLDNINADTARTSTVGPVKVTVVGLKTGYAIQTHCQALCDLGAQVNVIKDCIFDDNQARHDAVLNYILPVYCEDTSETLEVFLEGLDLQDLRKKHQSQLSALSRNTMDPRYRYITDCNRGGHFPLYKSCLLEKESWREWPDQEWYQNNLVLSILFNVIGQWRCFNH